MLLNLCGKNIRIDGRLIRISRLDEDKYQFISDPPAIIEGLRDSGKRVDLFTFLQEPEGSAEYAYPMEWDNLAVLPVSTFDQWWKNQIRSLPRNRARQAEKKGVVLKEMPVDDFLLRGICEIYNESPIRQGRRFPHYGMSLERARAYAGTYLNRSAFIGAVLGDSLIGFAKLTWDETCTRACLVHILSMIQHKDKAPTNALIAQAVRSCADRGISNLIYQNFLYGKRQQDSLSHFKEINGFQRLDLKRYYVPLTPVGGLALSAGLHHRLVDKLPESFGEKLREFRRAWYSRRFPEFTGA